MKALKRSMLLAWCMLIFGVGYAAASPAQGTHGGGMMDGGMMGGGMMHGGMMIACVLFGVLLLAALVLGILALVKYLRSDRHRGP